MKLKANKKRIMEFSIFMIYILINGISNISKIILVKLTLIEKHKMGKGLEQLLKVNILFDAQLKRISNFDQYFFCFSSYF